MDTKNDRSQRGGPLRKFESSHKVPTIENGKTYLMKKGLHVELVEGVDKIAECQAVGDGEFEDDEDIERDSHAVDDLDVENSGDGRTLPGWLMTTLEEILQEG